MLAETCQFDKFLSVTCQRKHRVQPFHARAACPMQSIRVVACETAIHCVHPSHLACTGYRTQHTPTSVSCVSHAFLGQSCQDRRDCQQAYRGESLRFPGCNRTQTETGRQTRHTAERLSRGAAISIHAAPRSFFLCAHSHARAHTHTSTITCPSLCTFSQC